uniref:Reverse transcriptase domain-containing protein n=2 Tax=Xenopus tropicalis TaxID=8364 RepID=A0A803KFZ4_XENTR
MEKQKDFSNKRIRRGRKHPQDLEISTEEQREEKILNLSDRPLNSTEKIVLEKGLTFCPTKNFDLFDTITDVNRFVRKLLLKKHFYSEDSANNSRLLHDTAASNPTFLQSHTYCFKDITSILHLESLQRENDPKIGRVGVNPTIVKEKFKSKSNYYPVHLRDNSVNLFQKNIELELTLLHEKTKKDKKKFSHVNNLSFKERKALTDLEKDNTIVIRKADKGGLIVILNKQDYLSEVQRQLSDNLTYRTLETNPLSYFEIELDALLSEALEFEIIDDKLFSFLKPDKPKVAIFHYLPKVHKKERPPPGRPIIAGIGSLGENLCEYIDFYLQPLVLRLPSYLKDSNHLIHTLRTFHWIHGTHKWASIDVVSLYSCIPHSLGLEAIRYHLIHFSTYEDNLIAFILRAIQFLLTHNFFLFDKKYYLQNQGTAMGAKFAPSYANLFLGWWEDRHIFNNNIFHEHIQYYGRFIDDIVIIWSGTSDKFKDFLTSLNTNTYNLQFTFEINDTHLNYLDIKLSANNHAITTTIFRKQCSANTILDAKSSHPRHLIRNIPYSQFLRLKRICS